EVVMLAAHHGKRCGTTLIPARRASEEGHSLAGASGWCGTSVSVEQNTMAPGSQPVADLSRRCSQHAVNCNGKTTDHIGNTTRVQPKATGAHPQCSDEEVQHEETR